jgi:NitT/TauT family transport system ATP-binding protein
MTVSASAAHENGKPAIELRGVRRRFDSGVVAIEGIDLSVPARQFVAVLGPSGCGKTTLLRLIAGFDHPQSGSVAVDDGTHDDPDSAHAPIAYVFQDAHLLPWRTVLRNVALPLELAGQTRHESLAAAERALVQVGLLEVAARFPAALSGGMRMRVSIARALVTTPHVLLMDEPFAALDELTRAYLDDELRALWRAHAMTVVFVTHAVVEAAYLAERVIVLSPRPASVVADIPVALPAERTPGLRDTLEFSRVTHALSAALRAGAR